MPPATRKPVKPEPDPEDAAPVAAVAPEPDPEPEAPAESGHALLNPGTTAVTYDVEGRQAAPGEVVTVEQIDEVGAAAIERGYLIEK